MNYQKEIQKVCKSDIDEVVKTLQAVPTPAATKTYTPIPFVELVYQALLLLDEYKYKVEDISVKYAYNNKNVPIRMVCFIDYCLNTYDHHGITMRLGILSSHDKSKPVVLAGGGKVMMCSNGMVIADLIEVRRHTGSAMDDIIYNMRSIITDSETIHFNLVNFANELKRFPLTEEAVYSLIGILYCKGCLERQLEVDNVLHQYKQARVHSHPMFNEVSLWGLYNWVTETLKTSRVGNSLSAHKKLTDIAQWYISKKKK